MKNTLSMLAIVIVGLLGHASAQTADEVVSRVQATQKNLKDVAFKVSGQATMEGSAQKIDMDIQAIPAQNVARINFNAPDALADNVVVVDGKKVRNYLFLTNQITEQDANRTSSSGGLNFSFSQFTDAAALLSRYDVKLVDTQTQSGAKVFVLEGASKDGGTERSRVWITEQGWRPVRVQVLGTSGRVVSDLNITNYKTNSGLSATKLKALPKDAEVIRR